MSYAVSCYLTFAHAHNRVSSCQWVQASSGTRIFPSFQSMQLKHIHVYHSHTCSLRSLNLIDLHSPQHRENFLRLYKLEHVPCFFTNLSRATNLALPQFTLHLLHRIICCVSTRRKLLTSPDYTFYDVIEQSSDFLFTPIHSRCFVSNYGF